MIDNFQSNWHAFRRVLEQESDKNAARLSFELIGDYTVEIRNLALRDPIATVMADTNTKKIKYKDPEGDGYLRLDELEDETKFTDSRTQTALPSNEAARDFIQRLLKMIVVHVRDPKSPGQFLCGAVPGGCLEVWPQPELQEWDSFKQNWINRDRTTCSACRAALDETSVPVQP